MTDTLVTENTVAQNDTVKDATWSTREVPWMKIGKIAPTMKATDAAKAGGLDFTVSQRSLSYRVTIDGKEKSMTAPNRKAIVRDDTGDMLGITSAKMYKVLQYSEAFEFMDTIDPWYVAAGALKKGRHGFMVVKAPFDLHVLGGEDKHDLYGVLRTSMDCTRAVEIMVMPLRARCMNQLTLSSFSKDVPHRWSIRHTSTMWERLAEAKDSLAKLGNYAARFDEITQRLADIPITDGQAREVLTYVIPARKKQVEVIDRIVELMNTSEHVGYAGTGWGLVNAVSEHFDWGRSGGTAESRFLAAIEGQTTKAINRTAAHLLRSAAN